MEFFTNPEVWAALLTLIALEIVLGIDNIVFITILVGALPEHQRHRARQIGLGLALLMRLLLLFTLAWIIGLVDPWFTVFGEEISGRDLILLSGGLFLLAKSTHEIHNSLEMVADSDAPRVHQSFLAVISQIAVIDMVFSLDSVITAVGMVEDLLLMVIAIIVSMGVMLLSAGAIGEFVDRNPTFKMLALSFLILIGCTLVAEGLDFHVPRGYIYFAMAFSVGVEFLNMLARRRKAAAHMRLHKKISSSQFERDSTGTT